MCQLWYVPPELGGCRNLSVSHKKRQAQRGGEGDGGERQLGYQGQQLEAQQDRHREWRICPAIG